MVLETTRLQIIPLTIEQFCVLLNGVGELEKEMNLVSSGKSLDVDTQRAMEMLYEESLLHADNYNWFTNWQIILKSENKAIGSACFMKEPDAEGNVEIGYGINDDYRCKGYMTEAVIAMCQWAFLQEKVKAVIAETEIDNYGSHRVLEKSGMIKYKHSDNSIWWIIEKQESADC